MIEITGVYIGFGILLIAIIVLLVLFLRLTKKMDTSEQNAIGQSKIHTNNEIAKLDRETVKYRVDTNGEVDILSPDKKHNIGYWKLEKTIFKEEEQ